MQYIRLSLGSVLFVTTSLVAWIALSADPSLAAEKSGAPSEKELELIAILKSEDSPAADKAITCKHLTVHGSREAVPELIKLVYDERLASWSRIALEAIPGPEADEALRHATETLTGNLLIGCINSIGVRRDAQAVELLTARLQDQDAEVAAAAAVALGRIGNVPASKSLRQALAAAPDSVRSAIAEGTVLCAEHILTAGDQTMAVAMYDEVRSANVPKQRIVEATRGAILARKPDAGIILLLEQFKSREPTLFQIALKTAREFPGSAVDKALADELDRIAPERAPLLVTAMADRKETVVLAAILKAAGKGLKPTRLSAISALGQIGDVSCLSPLLQITVESDADLVVAAKSSLGTLPGEGVDKAIVARLPKAEGKLYPVLIEIVGVRRIEAIAELLKALDHSDAVVRTAALVSLGTTVPPKNLNSLISQVVSPKHSEDAPVAEQALKTACIRMPDREVCSTELAAALDRASVPTKSVLLNILADVGGTKALQTVGSAAKSKTPELQDTSTKLLGKWMTIDAAPVLLDLAKTAPEEKYQLRAVGGYIRIVRQFAMPEEERLEMCKTAFELAKRPADQKLLLDLLKRTPSLDRLKLVVKVIDDAPDIKDEATQAAIAIAQKLNDKGPEVAELLSKAGLGKVKLEIVKAEYGAGDTMKNVTEILQKQATDMQLITLPMSTYNESFSGDPAPNVVKMLKITYRINDKEGNVSLAENALIILPMPK